jgi:L-ornithine Nalpha-acyltransferase
MSLISDDIQLPHSAPPRGQRKLEVRLACSEDDLRAAQRLRYRVFYEELGAVTLDSARTKGLDQDHYDAFCDHLLVIDPTNPQGQNVVGTYRLMPGSRRAEAGDFYSAREFDLAPLLANGPAPDKLLECGRSCVAAGYRGNHTVQLLWRGIAAYMARHKSEAMFGCASLSGTNIGQLGPALDYLRKNALAPEPLRVKARPDYAVSPIAAASVNSCTQTIQKSLPPLIKAYLRLGAWVGEDAALDLQFDTTDVFILLPVDNIPARYYRHFDR